MKLGDKIIFHSKVNIDPLGSHCSICGRKGQNFAWFVVDWDDRLLTEKNSQAKGSYPIGPECAKKLDLELLNVSN